MLNARKIIVAILDLIRSQSFVQISPSSFGTRVHIDWWVNELWIIYYNSDISPHSCRSLPAHEWYGVNIAGIDYNMIIDLQNVAFTASAYGFSSQEGALHQIISEIPVRYGFYRRVEILFDDERFL